MRYPTRKEVKAFNDFLTSLKGSTVSEVVSIYKDQKIGEGATRIVYTIKGFDWLVMKKERLKSTIIHNVLECAISDSVQHLHGDLKFIKDMHAKCYGALIDPQYSLLFQQRVTLDAAGEFPEKLPSMFTDIKKNNFGWIGKQLVCFDYANNFYRMFGLCCNQRTRKVHWYE
jgi:hypothetical protein